MTRPLASPGVRPTDPRRGAALVLVLLLTFAVAGMALGAILMSSGAQLTTRFSAREVAMQAAANGGLEIARDSMNRGIFDSLLPANGFTTLESNVSIVDAYGGTLGGISRSTYIGRTGGRTGGSATAGQYGSNFASALSVIRDQRGAVAARRLLLTQDSWSKFAVAINNWSVAGIVYGCGESVNGPFHSNTTLQLQSGCSSPKVDFAGPVTVAGSISNSSSGNFTAGRRTGVPTIPWPTPARIALMRQYAQDADAVDGDYDLLSSTNGSTTPGVRIEFLTIDANGNGSIEWNEGYMRVFVARNTSDTALAYLSAKRWPNVPTSVATVTTSGDPNILSRNCGGKDNSGANGTFQSAREIWDETSGGTTQKRNQARAQLRKPTRACYLGGDPRLFPTLTADTLTPDSTATNAAGYPFGYWKKRRAGAHASVSARRSGDAVYLIPLGGNPNFKGVIFVRGDVGISGTLRGRVSVYSTGNVVLLDDLLYYTPPGTNCGPDGDIFGAIATRNVIISDNNLQTPFRVGDPGNPSGNAQMWGGFDDTPRDEQYNMFFMAAGNAAAGTDGNFIGEGANAPPYSWWASSGGSPVHASAINERCGDAPAGCIRITGGLAMGRIDYPTYSYQAFGWAEAHSYDRCGAVNPPPYFPTTGRFTASRYYELDPVWLNQKGIANYFAALRAQ